MTKESIFFLTIIIRLVIDIPLAYFFWKQWTLRHLNGWTKIVRDMVTIWVIGFTIIYR